MLEPVDTLGNRLAAFTKQAIHAMPPISPAFALLMPYSVSSGSSAAYAKARGPIYKEYDGRSAKYDNGWTIEYIDSQQSLNNRLELLGPGQHPCYGVRD
jgi:hypothetical protein